MTNQVKLYFGGEQTRVPQGWTWVAAPFQPSPQPGRGRRVVHSYRHFRGSIVDTPAPEIEDLYTIISSVYLSDMWITRKRNAPDGWTRSLSLNIPVLRPDTWNDPEIMSTLVRLLGFVSSDRWELRFRQTTRTVWEPNLLGEPVERVALYSGGLDSVSFAMEALNTTASPTVVVSHSNPPGLNGLHKRLRPLLAEHVRPASFLVQVHRFDKKYPNESTQRTRALLFMAAGLLVCSGNGVGRLSVPENGFLAINPPLTASRPGACMTKSVHPTTLHLINTLLTAVGSPHHVHNPYALMTKGEVCRAALEQGAATLEQLAETVTCSRPQSYRKEPFANCGYCYACLVRHASLEAAGGDSTKYRTVRPADIRSDMANGKSDDVLALRDWLSRDFTARDLIAAAPFPPGTDFAALTAMMTRSRAEMAAVCG